MAAHLRLDVRPDRGPLLQRDGRDAQPPRLVPRRDGEPNRRRGARRSQALDRIVTVGRGRQARGGRAPPRDPRRPGRGRRVPGRRRRGPGRLQGPRLRGRRLHQPRRRPVHPQRDRARPGRRDQRPPQGARLRPRLVAGRRRLGRAAGRHLPLRPDPNLLPQAPSRPRRRRGGRGRPGRRPAPPCADRNICWSRLDFDRAQAFFARLRAAPISSAAAPTPSRTTPEGSGTASIWMVAIRSFAEIRWEMS